SCASWVAPSKVNNEGRQGLGITKCLSDKKLVRRDRVGKNKKRRTGSVSDRRRPDLANRCAWSGLLRSLTLPVRLYGNSNPIAVTLLTSNCPDAGSKKSPRLRPPSAARLPVGPNTTCAAGSLAAPRFIVSFPAPSLIVAFASNRTGPAAKAGGPAG